VTLTRGFWLGRTEVTRAQWERVMGPAELHPDKPNPFRHLDADLPMVSVSYADVQVYLRRLEALAPGERFRLPTEAEWEYACRAGTTTAFSTGARLPRSRAAFDDRSGAFPSRPVRVGSYPANPWGVHDMHGNVWEWTSDWYGPYPASPVAGPRPPAERALKVIRGGSWAFGADSARSACRYHHDPRHWGYSLGFRLVWVRDPPSAAGSSKDPAP
jgi:formylglycine-generating enzyme required for sulfatase activity